MKSIMLMVSLLGGIENPDFADRTNHNMQTVGVSYHGATIAKTRFSLDGESMNETLIGFSSPHVSLIGNGNMKMMNLNYPLYSPSFNLHVDMMQMDDMLNSVSFGVGYLLNDKAELKFNLGVRDFEDIEIPELGCLALCGTVDSEFANVQLTYKF